MNENNLTKLFSEAVSEYGTQRSLGQGKDSSVSSVQNIENIIPQYLTNLLDIHNTKYIIKGSCGVGKWAEVPWITIMNKKITTSVSKGFYLTYLLDSNEEQVYLAFMFAVTDNKELDVLIPQAKRIIKDKVDKTNITIGNIDSLGNSTRAKQYEKATVAFIRYSKVKMPENDAVWIEDLKNMMNIYEYYIQKTTRDYTLPEDIQSPTENHQQQQIAENSNPVSFIQNINTQDFIDHIYLYIKSEKFYYAKEEIINLYLSLRSKPFVIISGVSGTGKTKIVQLFAESIGATEENGRFKLIPVRPDWSDSSDLLGYLTLQEEYKKGPLAEIVEHAMNHPEYPHFALLDEMNLARVEYYFSDVLSVMESRKKGENGEITSSPLVDPKLYKKAAFHQSPEGPLYLPNNLYIIGTVNMDETTHPFSKKVLDRANTIEFNQISLNYFDFLTGNTQDAPTKVISNKNLEASYIHLKDAFNNHQDLIINTSKKLEAVNVHLAKINAQVGYRVRDEICFYMVHNEEANLLSKDEAMDFCYMQKILPRISGGQVVRSVLEALKVEWMNQGEAKYPKSVAKIEEMLERLKEDGFTSFWIA